MAEIVFLPAAEAEYQDALSWYHERSEQAAANFENAVASGLQRIAEAPLRWTRIDGRHRVHFVTGFPYSLVYRAQGELVIIVAIAHGRREPGFWRRRD